MNAIEVDVDIPTTANAGWIGRMALWSLALVLASLAAVWACSKWPVVHMAYCKHLLRSSDAEQVRRGLDLVAEKHLRAGMTLEQVREIFDPAPMSEENSPSEPADVGLKYAECVVWVGHRCPDCGGFVSDRDLFFDSAGRLVGWRLGSGEIRTASR